MGNYDISFNQLGIYLKDVPKSFHLFGIEIALYGLIIGLGTVCGFLLALHLAQKSGVKKDLVWDYIIWGIIVGVIGARLYYVIFSWDYYKDDLLSIFNIRQGGLAIYGGVIGAIGAMIVFCKLKKTSFTALLDVAVPGLILGQIIGRWGNFFNREVFGSYSDGLLSMQIPVNCPYVRSRDITQQLWDQMYAHDVNYISVHPTFLYEGLLNLAVLLIMLIYRKHKKFSGEIALIYLGGYGIVRFFVEGIRTDQLKFAGTEIAVSQMLGILLFVLALAADIVIRVRMARAKQCASGDSPAKECTIAENNAAEDNAAEDDATEDDAQNAEESTAVEESTASKEKSEVEEVAEEVAQESETAEEEKEK